MNTETIATAVKTVRNPGAYATGKGTTAKIKEFFAARFASYSVDQVGGELGLPSRQLSKRLAELVKGGSLTKSSDGFRATKKLNPEITVY